MAAFNVATDRKMVLEVEGPHFKGIAALPHMSLELHDLLGAPQSDALLLLYSRSGSLYLSALFPNNRLYQETSGMGTCLASRDLDILLQPFARRRV